MTPTASRFIAWVALFVALPVYTQAQTGTESVPIDPDVPVDTMATDAASVEATAMPLEAATDDSAAMPDVVPEPPPEPSSSPLASIADYVAIHGFGNYGAGWTHVPDRNTNEYQFGDHNGDFGFVNFSLRQLVQPIPELRFAAGQSFSVQDGTVNVELDLAGAQWTPNRTFSLRVGRILSPLGIYTEVYRVGTLRPFGTLPTAIYANAGFINQSYDGAEIALSFESDSGWRARFSAIGGRAIIPQDGSILRLVEGALMVPLNQFNSRVVMDLMMGAHVSLETPVDGLGFAYGIAGSTPRYTDLLGDETTAQNWNNVVMIGSAYYVTDRLELRSEVAFRYNLDRDAVAPTARMIQRNIGFYAEAAYRVIDQVQIGLRVERMRQNIDNLTAAAFYPRRDSMGNVVGTYESMEFSTDIGAVVSYWWNRDFVLKLEYHFIDGNRFAHPSDRAIYEMVQNGRPIQRQTHFVGFTSAFSF